eukprot:COSAG05_NODE_1753_length_4142_cov_43.953500_6_plen_350_part_01
MEAALDQQQSHNYHHHLLHHQQQQQPQQQQQQQQQQLQQHQLAQCKVPQQQPQHGVTGQTSWAANRQRGLPGRGAGVPSSAQAHQIAQHQMQWGRLYQEKASARLESLATHHHQFEDQLHVLNFAFNMGTSARKRRAIASLAELSAERAKSLTEKELLNAMLIYMQRKGLTQDTVRQFREGKRPCTHDVRQFVAEQSYEYHASRVANESMFLLYAQEDPVLFEQQYATLKNFARKAHNMFKPELLAVLFPIFVHCFFDLMQTDTAERATKFLRTNRVDFELLYGPDLEKMVLIREQAHLASSDIAQAFLRNRMTVWMCRDTFGLLATCLSEEKLTLMFHTVYHYVDLQVY